MEPFAMSSAVLSPAYQGMSKILDSHLVSDTMSRFIPEPKNRLGFSTFLRGIENAASSAAGFAGISPEYASLLDKQIEVQLQMQLVSMYSNIEKSKHETQMAAVRNIRVG